MKVAVWDTYVQRDNGKIMHFDILVDQQMKDVSQILLYGEAFLSSKPFNTDELTSRECNFCHIEQPSIGIKNQILKTGYSIIEMENCN